MKAEPQTTETAESHHGERTGTADGTPSHSFDRFLTNVVAPVDFSAASLRALESALTLASTAGAAVHLLHVFEPTTFLSGLDTLPIVLPDKEVVAQRERDLGAIADKHSSCGLRISSNVRVGKAAHEIVAYTETANADLVVIATHGYTGLKHLLLGSVAEHVVRKAPCPVMVVRERMQSTSRADQDLASLTLRKILVPTDFSFRSLEAVRYAGKFASQFGGKLTLMHSVHLPGTAMGGEIAPFDVGMVIEASREAAHLNFAKLLQEYLPAGVVEDCEVRVGPPLAEIPEFAKAGDFDLIICATHGYTGIKHALLGSTAEGIARHAPCSVLVVGERALQPCPEGPAPS